MRAFKFPVLGVLGGQQCKGSIRSSKMVEIEQEKEEEPPIGTYEEDINATTTTTVAVSEDSPPEPSLSSRRTNDDDAVFEGWTKLMGKDLLIRPIQEKADSTAVQPQDTVVIDFVGRLAENPAITDGPIFQQATDWIITIGEKDVVPALEMGVRFMHDGETVAVWSHGKFAYGTGQRKHTVVPTEENDTDRSNGEYILPANSHVRYEVTVKRILSEAERTSAAGQVQLARSKKMIGNDIYANEWFGDYGPLRAKQQYKRGAETLQYLLQTASADDSDIDEDISKEAREVMLDCLNNIAALHLRAKEYKLAKEAAVQVLTHDPDNFKALIRAAKAALLDPGSSYEEVDAVIKAAAERSDASDADVQRLRAEFRRRKQAYKEKSKAMFSKFGESSAKKKDAGEEESATTATSTAAVTKEEEEESASTKNTADTDTKVDANSKSWLNWREWDWKNTILPYGVQLILPFITYYFFTLAKKREAEVLEEERSANEDVNTEF